MSVEETHSAILRCRRQHLIFVAVALPITIGWIIFTACVSSDMAVITGIVTGALVGLALGVLILMRFLKDYKDATNL